MPYSATRDPLILVEAEDNLRMVVGNALEGRELALLRFGAFNRQTDLDIHSLFLPFGNEIDLAVVKFADRNAIAAMEKLQEYSVLNDAADIAVPISGEPVTKPDVTGVVLFVEFQVAQIFDVITQHPTNEKRLFQAGKVVQDLVNTRGDSLIL